MARTDEPEAAGESWRSSLYARAALFLILGAASLIGAVAALATTMVDESVDRLLGERIELSRTVGVFVEHRMTSDLERIALAAASALEIDPSAEAARTALSREYLSTLYQEGAFVLDMAQRPLAAVPNGFDHLGDSIDLGELVREAELQGGAVTSGLVRLGVGARPVLVMLAPLRATSGRSLGYVGGVLSLATNDLLEALSQATAGASAGLDLVDRDGIVVASTDRRELFKPGDHERVLSQAIATGRDLRGRCHGCHTAADDAGVPLVQNVLAFAPLPSLGLGVAVHQPEREALEPAFALRTRLVVVGLAFVSLFLLFAGLSVRSVVRPIKRLTRQVRRMEEASGRAALPSFGRDEVGELASALDRWRGRMLDSLETTERHREALHAEIEGTRRHLEALQDVAAQYMLGAEADGIVDRGLHLMVALLGLSNGAIRVRFGERLVLARLGLPADLAAELLDRCESSFAGRPPHESPLGFGICEHGQLEDQCLHGLSLATVVGAFHQVPQGPIITCVLADTRDRGSLDSRWLSSLVHHLGISVTNRLLHDQDLVRQKQQEQYLHRVLKAQEDERRRVARELHDTVAQDLAALRLGIERTATRPADEELRGQLRALEEQAHGVLQSVRRTLFDLRLSVLENMGFLPTLQWHIERVEREHGVRGILAVQGEERPLEYDVAVSLFRIFQESLQNIVQHSRAEHVSVTAVYGSDTVGLVIEDDGRGFDVEAVRARAGSDQSRGLGLLGMEERARLLGGTVEFASAPDEGTTLTVVVPLPEARVGANLLEAP